MTAVELLDELEAGLAKAGPRSDDPWRHEGGPTVHVGRNAIIAQTDMAEHAALIVAAVNALNPLVQIVREFWNEHDGRTCHDRTADSHNGVTPCPTRVFIAEAFGRESGAVECTCGEYFDPYCAAHGDPCANVP